MAVPKTARSIHVMPHEGKWVIKQEGHDEVARTLDTQEEAVRVATEMARMHKVELMIHNREGRIGGPDVLGNDRRLPEGPRG